MGILDLRNEVSGTDGVRIITGHFPSQLCLPRTVVRRCRCPHRAAKCGSSFPLLHEMVAPGCLLDFAASLLQFVGFICS